MKYSLSRDDAGRIKVEVDGKFTMFPYMQGLSIRHLAYIFLSQYGIAWKDTEPVELSEIPEFPDRLFMGAPAEEHPDPQI